MNFLQDSTLRTICERFGIVLNGHDCTPFGSGLINSTYLLKDRHGDDDWILQRINTAVFQQPEWIAYNSYLAAEHLNAHFPDYRFMRHRRTTDGRDIHSDDSIGHWRVFPFIRNTIAYDGAVTPEQAYSAAQQFGRLTRYLDGVYVNAFKVIIPGFHDLGARFVRFKAAIDAAQPLRQAMASDVTAFFLKHAAIVDEFKAAMMDPDVNTRITHNDTKLNNVLFDVDTNEAVCVIDLDTLMPGKAIFDLGDMIRTFISTAAEDDPDPSHTVINEDVFEQLVAGYLSEMSALMSFSERTLVHWCGRMLMYEQGIRFLTDFLQNDTYYKTDRPEHNLDRARNQMNLLVAYSAKEKALVARIRPLLK